MSRTIDERIVSMQFDNKHFESNVKTSLNTLDKLKQSLNLTGAAKGLENISSAADKCNLSPLSRACETVGLKFNAMYAIADQAFRNITNSAMNAGKRVVSAFTIEPVKTGLAEYETQIGAIQTILANTQSKGSTLNDVNRALGELNTYADKTIYNFTEMTKNIGTFTAAGVDLDKSVTSIKGIANLAAISGSTSQQASTAMYQLSQALASGTVKLMDWNSVVNAGMGGEVFQTALKRTATQMGYNVDEMIEKYGSFRESLTQGEWLTAEVLTETLTQLSGAYTEADLISQGYSEKQAKEIMELAKTAESAATDVKTFTQLMDTLKESAQSGWTQTWEIIIGDFESAKELWSGISEFFGGIIGASAESRNAVLSGAFDSNWDKLINKIGEAGVESADFEDAIKKVAKSHNLDIDSIIGKYGSLEKAFQAGAISANTLKEAIKSLNKTGGDFNLTKGITKLQEEGDHVREIEKALQSLGYELKGKDGKDYGDDGKFGTITRDAVKEFQKAQGLKITGLVDEATLAALKEATKTTSEFKANVDDLIDGITELGGREKLIQSFKSIFESIGRIVKPIGKAFKEVFPPTTAEQITGLINGFQQLTAKFNRWTRTVEGKAVIDGLASAFKGFFSIIDIGWTFVTKLAGGIFDLIGNFTGLAGGIIKSAGSLGDWISGLRDWIKEGDIFGKTVNGIVGFIQQIIDAMGVVTSFLREKFVMPGWTGFLGVLSGIWNVIRAIGNRIAEVASDIGSALSSAFRSGDIGNGLDVLNGGLLAGVLIGLKKFFKGFGDSLGEGFGLLDGIKGILSSVTDSFEAMQQTLKSGILLKIAAAIAILAVSLLMIASIDPAKLSGALASIAVLFGELILALKLFSGFSSGLTKTGRAAIAMIGMATAVLILASALKKIADLEWEELGKGLIGVGVLMAEISLFLKFTKFSGMSVGTAAGIVLLASAIKILASACKNFGSMSWGEIGKGLASIGALLLELSIFTKLTGNAKHVISTGLSLVLIGAAMKILASAISDFSALNWDEIGKGLVSMAGALLAVAIAMKLMPKNMLSAGVGLALVSASLLILAEALSRMGGMTWGEIGRGLASLGGSILILAIGLNAMNGTLTGSAALLIAAGAIAILTPALAGLGSMSWEAIAKGLVVLAGAFIVIGLAGALLGPLVPAILGLAGAFALIGVSVLAIGVGLAAAAAGLAAFAGVTAASATAIVASLTIIITGIVALIPTIAREIGNGIVEICKVIGESVPTIAESVLKLVAGLLKALADYTPQIIDSLMQFLISALNGLAERTPELVSAVLNVITSLFSAVTDAIVGLDGSTLAKAAIGVALMSALMALFGALAPLIPGALIGVLGMGVLIVELAAVIAAIGALAQIPGLQWLIGEGANVMASIGSAIGGFVGSIIGGVAAGITSALPQIGTDLSDFMTNLTPFLDGAKQIDDGMLSGVESIVDIIGKLTAASLFESVTSWITGGSSLQSFADQLVPFGTAMKNFATEVAGIDETTVTAAANAGAAMAAMADTIPNTGGLVAFFTGDNDMATFGAQLVAFGEAMKNFSTSVSGIDVEAITAASTVGTALITMAETIPNTGGLISFFTGDNDLATFGSQLVEFGKAIKSFSTEVTGIDESAITAAANAGSALSAMANTLPETGGIFSWFSGDQNMETFGNQLVGFGQGMKKFSDEVAGINVTATTAAVFAARSLNSLSNSMADGNISNLSSYGMSISTFGYYLSDFYAEISGIDASKIIGISLGINSIISAFDGASAKVFGAGESLMTSFSNGITSKISDVVIAVNSITSGIITAIGFNGVNFETAGSGITDNIATGMKLALPSIATVLNTMANGMLISINNTYNGFYNAGVYLVKGLAKGINNSTYIAREAAKAMAKSALNAAEKELGINSPSKETYGMGIFFGKGFVNALGDYEDKTYNAGKSIAESAKSGLSNAIAKIKDAIESDVDTQPTIRPVLDLTDISNGVGVMNGMFGINPSVNAMARFNAVGSMMNRNQNGVNDDLISAIENLGNRLSNISGDTYTVQGITYDDGSNVSSAVKALVRAARMERRI